MTPDEISELLRIEDDEHGKFERIKNPLARHRDLHAFLLLEKLNLGKGYKMVSGASRDQIYIAVDIEDLANVINESQVIDLKRCGVFLEDDTLSMFV